MKTTYTVKNFRIFDENGATISLAPLTIFTGRNSAGKSSITKSIELLESYLMQIKRDADHGNGISLEEYKLDFTKHPLTIMGGYDKVVHKGTSSKEITFEYSVYSTLLSRDLCVSLTFCSDSADKLNSGFLIRLTIKADDVVIYCSDKELGSYYNLLQTVAPFLNYLSVKNVLFSKRIGITKQACGEETYSIEQEQKDLSEIKTFNKTIVKDALTRALSNAECIRNLVPEEIVKWSEDNDSLFMRPVVEYLDKLTKSDFHIVVLRLLDNYISQTINDMIDDGVEPFVNSSYYHKVVNKMIDEFEESSFDSFKQFILCKEHEFLTNVDVNRSSALFARVSPKIPTTESLRLRNEDTLEWDNSNLKDIDISFEDYYVACSILESSTEKKHENPFFMYSDGQCYHRIYELLCIYASNIVKEALLPNWVGMISHINAQAVSVKRHYLPSDENDHFSNLLKEYIDMAASIQRIKERRLSQAQCIKDSNARTHNLIMEYINNAFKFNAGEYVNHWIKELGIGSHIEITVEGEGCVYIRLHKTNDDEGSLLADEGYGISQLVYLLLAVETKIMKIKYHSYIEKDSRTKQQINTDVVFLSEKLNLLIDLDNKDVLTVSIEEPEIHLHPQYQSKLADLFVDAMKYGIHFIVETHSEYLIRKLQYLVATSKYASQEELEKDCLFKVFYFAEQGRSYDMQFRPNGKFMQAFGEGFFDEADKWVMKMFELEEE